MVKGAKHFYHPRVGNPAVATLHGTGVREPMWPGVVNRPGGTGDWLLMFYYQACEISDAAGRHVRPPHSLVLWSPRDAQYYGRSDTDWSHSWTHFGGRRIGRWVREAMLPVNQVVEHVDAAPIEEQLHALHAEASHMQPDDAIIANLIENLLRQVGRSLRTTPDDAPPQNMLAVKRHVEAYYDQPMQLTELANMAHLSVAHFLAEYKRWFGTPAIDQVIDLRMRRAAYLLRDRNLRIKEIAARVGYDDPYHFSKLFRKHYDVSPRQYRGQLGGS